MMKYSSMTIALVGVVGLGMAPALAQPMPSSPGSGAPAYGYTPPPGTPVTPDDQGRQGAVPPVGRQIRAARSVGNNASDRSPDGLLRQADTALRQRKVAVANELLERAQTASLNGQQQGDNSDRRASGIAEARQAVIGGDIAGARRHIAEALGNPAPDAAADKPAAPHRPRHR